MMTTKTTGKSAGQTGAEIKDDPKTTGADAAKAAREPADPEGKLTFRSSKLMAEALGEHGDALELSQRGDEDEVAFAVRCIEVLGSALTERTAQLAGLRRSLAAQKGQTTRARREIEEIEEAARPRELGPLAELFADFEVEGFTATDLMTAIDASQEIVLAFSDGSKELAGIRPRKVGAEDFVLTRGRVVFRRSDLVIEAPGGEGPELFLAGIALLLDGEQYGWSPMARPTALGAGQAINLSGNVVFG